MSRAKAGKPKFRVGQIVVDSDIVPKVLGVVLRNRKTGQYGVRAFYMTSERVNLDLENWRPLTPRESGQRFRERSKGNA